MMTPKIKVAVGPCSGIDTSEYSVVLELSIASAFSRTVDVVGAGLHIVGSRFL